MSDSFENSPEYDDWIESGGRDEDYEYYYSGLNLNQDKATKLQTVQIVRQGEATLY